jgi:hypothetical protein
MADNATITGALVLETFEGNTRTFVFKLRKKGTRQPFDASGADKFLFECERHEVENEDPFEPIEVLPTDVGANFAQGIIPVTVEPTAPSPITEKKGSYLFSLTMVAGIAEVTIARGQLEVSERPGFPHP